MNDGVKHLKQALKKLEESACKIVETQGYTSEMKKIRLLEELIKEQLKNENTSRSTSTAR